MRRWLPIAFAAFVTLTRPDGVPVYILPSMAIDYTATAEHRAQCDVKAKTYIRTLAGALCVLETPEQVGEKFKDGL